jgi:Ca2+-binding EF-hand superfamily protein
MTSSTALLRSAHRILLSVGPEQLNEARRIVTLDVALEAESLMKSKLHRKFHLFDDVAFNEVYAHFCSASTQGMSGSQGTRLSSSVLQNNSESSSSHFFSFGSGGGGGGGGGRRVGGGGRGGLLSDILSDSRRPEGRQHDANEEYIDYRALDLPSFRSVMVELAPRWSKDLVGLDRLFVAFDADHNGFVDVHEFMQGIQAMCQVGTKEEKLRLLFMSLDGRGSGTLGDRDVGCLLKTMYALLSSKEGEEQVVVRRSAIGAAAEAIVSVLSTKRPEEEEEEEENQVERTGTRIDFEEFLHLPSVQPDVLKMMSLVLPYASRKSVMKSVRKAMASPTKKKMQRTPSVEEIHQLKTSPRGDQ